MVGQRTRGNRLASLTWKVNPDKTRQEQAEPCSLLTRLVLSDRGEAPLAEPDKLMMTHCDMRAYCLMTIVARI